VKQGPQPTKSSATVHSDQVCGVNQHASDEQCQLADASLQERYRAAHLDQLRRRACPGCGEGDVIPTSDSTTERPLNLNDLAQAHQRSDEELNRLAAPILADLLAIEVVTGVDGAGIARRGSVVFTPILQGREIAALASAYVLLRRAGAQTALLDQIELARGTVRLVAD